MCQHIWTHYRFTGDLEFLRRMYPVLRGASLFMLEFLTENQDGYLVTAPSISPENKFLTGDEETAEQLLDEIAVASRCSPNHPQISAVSMASTMDMSILRELFANTIQAASDLKLTEEPPPDRLDEAEKRLPPSKRENTASFWSGTAIMRNARRG